MSDEIELLKAKLVITEKERNDYKYLLEMKNDTANTFMNQIKRLQKQNDIMERALIDISENMSINDMFTHGLIARNALTEVRALDNHKINK